MAWSVAAAALALLVWGSPTQAAISPACVPGALPTSPPSTATALDVVNFGEGMHVDVWTQPCADGPGSVPMMRVAPTTAVPFLCSGDFTLLQNGLRYNALLLPALTSARVCADLVAPTTLIVDAADGPAIGFDGSQAFTLVFAGWDDGGLEIFRADVGPAASGPVAITAAVLPGSRSVPLGTAATVFATVIASGPGAATNCTVAPATAIPASFEFRTTDPGTNAVTGSPNQPAAIAPGGLQTFVLAFTPTAPFAATTVELTFRCTGAPAAPIVEGVNTLLLSADAGAVPDIVALAATTTRDGIVDIPGTAGTGAFAVAAVNAGGAGGPITVSADTGDAVLPVSASVCRTDGSGACMSPPSSSVTVRIGPAETPTFAVFVTSSDAVPFIPATNRVFVRFVDAASATRGETSVAVRTR